VAGGGWGGLAGEWGLWRGMGSGRRRRRLPDEIGEGEVVKGLMGEAGDLVVCDVWGGGRERPCSRCGGYCGRKRGEASSSTL